MAKKRPPKDRKFPKKFRVTLEKVVEQKKLRDEGYSDQDAKRMAAWRPLAEAVALVTDTCYREFLRDTPYFGVMAFDEVTGQIRSSFSLTDRIHVQVTRTDPPWASWQSDEPETSGSQ